jgi:hypothetical protein
MFVARCPAHCSSVTSVTGPETRPAALLTTTSSLPWLAMVASTAAREPSLVPMSAVT